MVFYCFWGKKATVYFLLQVIRLRQKSKTKKKIATTQRKLRKLRTIYIYAVYAVYARCVSQSIPRVYQRYINVSVHFRRVHRYWLNGYYHAKANSPVATFAQCSPYSNYTHTFLKIRLRLPNQLFTHHLHMPASDGAVNS